MLVAGAGDAEFGPDVFGTGAIIVLILSGIGVSVAKGNSHDVTFICVNTFFSHSPKRITHGAVYRRETTGVFSVAGRITAMSWSSFPRRLPWTILVSAILWSGLTPTEVKAFDLTFTASGTNGSDGSVAATVNFAPNGTTGLEITVTNTESGTLDKGQAISDISFTVGGTLTGGSSPSTLMHPPTLPN